MTPDQTTPKRRGRPPKPRLDLAGEKEPHNNGTQRQDPTRPQEIPLQEGQPQSQETRLSRRTQEPTPQEVVALPNPECSNPACIITCSPTCENLWDAKEYHAAVRAERQHTMGSDPTLRSMDVT